MKKNNYLYFSTAFLVLIKREIYRFLSLYKQTIMPGAISSSLYIIIFGHALGTRIGDIGGVPYMHYIIPGLIMMSVVTHAYQNSSSSIMQAKYLKFIEDYLIAPMSPMEICFGFIILALFPFWFYNFTLVTWFYNVGLTLVLQLWFYNLGLVMLG